jgi:hypothetical protein
MKRAALHESVRRGIAIARAKHAGAKGPAFVQFVEVAMSTLIVRVMADDVVDVIAAEHPGVVEP